MDSQTKRFLKALFFFLRFAMFGVLVVLILNVVTRLVDHAVYDSSGRVVYVGPSGLGFFVIIVVFVVVVLVDGKKPFLHRLRL